jgi:hypothetical protein
MLKAQGQERKRTKMSRGQVQPQVRRRPRSSGITMTTTSKLGHASTYTIPSSIQRQDTTARMVFTTAVSQALVPILSTPA